MPRIFFKSATALAAVALIYLAAATAGADNHGCGLDDYDGDSDHERARRAVACGEIMPLADVLAAVRPHLSGKVIETEFEKEDGVWVYELKYIDPQGHMVEVYVDAKTGRIINTDGDD